MPSAVDVRVFKTVDGIGREAIDSLVDDGFFTYGWFKTLETSKPISLNPFYVTAYNEGKLVAFAPCFHDVADEYFRYGPSVVPFMKRALNVRSRLHLGKDHVLLCYSPFCYRSKIYVARGLDEGLLIGSMLREIDAICKREQILFSSFLFVSEFDKELPLYLSSLGYHKIPKVSTFFYLDVPWRCFEDYLNSLDRVTRHNVRREMRCFGENGLTIEETSNFKDLHITIADLSSNLYTKYSTKRTQGLEPSFFEALGDYAKDNSKIFIAKKKGNVVGFALCIRQGRTLDAFQCGFNYEYQEKFDFTYFNLGYYAPIRWAIQEGIRKIYYRRTAERVKLRRGCKPERVYCFVKCHDRLVNSQISNYIDIERRIW
jgi:predicted N-acyltransferase